MDWQHCIVEEPCKGATELTDAPPKVGFCVQVLPFVHFTVRVCEAVGVFGDRWEAAKLCEVLVFLLILMLEK